MSINDKKGINLTSGFKYVGRQPLDVRLVAEDESDLQSLVDNGATYNGMVVWVNSTSKRKVFNGNEFIEDVSPDTIGNINDVLEQINGGGTSSGGGSSSGGSTINDIYTTTYDSTAGYYNIDRTLTNGTYILNVIVGNIYIFNSILIFDDTYNECIASTIAGELLNIFMTISLRTYNNQIRGQILAYSDNGLAKQTLDALVGSVQAVLNTIPTIILTKINDGFFN